MVSLTYIEGIVNQEILDELRSRLKEIDTDMILETGQIEQLIDKNTFSPFSGMGLTQKPDVLAQRLLEGRVGLLVDGTPHVLTIPEMFMDNFRTAEDYYNNTLYVNFVRIFRGIALFTTVVLPGLAIAIFTYNQEMLPSVFLSSLISSSMRTPMPFSFEILLMIVMFELIKEAGTRMPKTVGSAVTIVGSLIIGDAAINAGLVSAPSVIVVAVAALASFVLPSLTAFMMVYRTLFWLLGSIMGIIGIGAGVVIMIVHISSTESFGRPILSSFSKQEMKDSLLHFPLKSLRYRPTSIARENVKRQR
jgi:spore germination protein KA